MLTQEGICYQLFSLFFRSDLKKMKEYVKLRFDIKKSDNKKLILKLSKKKLHVCGLMNFGVCTSQDSNLWNSTDFWQLLIFDEQLVAHGGVMIRTCEINSKMYLSISINPTNKLLSCVNSNELYFKLIKTCGVIAKKIGYSGVVIPCPENIYSNRSQIQTIVRSKNYKIEPLLSPKEYTYRPFYNYNSVYIVSLPLWRRLFKL
ncbi:MAG: hypothetical protein ACMXYB_03060 [Candidatus Woesearchaeota archaeon]